MIRKTSLLLLAFVLMGVSGCQSVPEQQPVTSTQEQRLPTPFSKGPTTPPGVKGPTSSPTSQSNSVVSETETVRYTLPQSPTVEVKQ